MKEDGRLAPRVWHSLHHVHPAVRSHGYVSWYCRAHGFALRAHQIQAASRSFWHSMPSSLESWTDCVLARTIKCPVIEVSDHTRDSAARANGRLNDETEAHIDRMDELDGRYEGHGMEAGGRTLSGASPLIYGS